MTYKIYPDDPSLVAGWNMDQSPARIIQDVSGNGNSGDILGSPIQGDGYLDFDGVSDYVTIPADPLIKVSDNFTVGGLFLYNSNNQLNSRILSLVDDASNNFRVYYEAGTSASSQLNIRVQRLGVAYGLTSVPLIMIRNKMQHITCVFSGGNTVLMYVDGTLITTSTATGGSASGGTDLRIGQGSLSSHYFGGRVVNSFFYNVAKSSDWVDHEYKRFLSQGI